MALAAIHRNHIYGHKWTVSGEKVKRCSIANG